LPQPIFQPIIGGGFDQLAGQNQFWAQFNASQDAQNIARREQATREYNDWLGNVSQLQRAEGAQQDLWAREDVSQALTRRAQERREREATRQFEEGLKYSREAMRAQEKLQRDQFNQQLALTKAEDQKESDLLASFGETFAPQVARTVETLQRLAPERAKAQMEVQTMGREFARKLNTRGVYYDGKSFTLRWAQGAAVNPEINTQMLKYNEELGRKVAEFTGLDQSYKLAVKQLDDLKKMGADGGFVVRDDGTIYNYKLKRAFGKPITAYTPPPRQATWKEKLLEQGRKNLSDWTQELNQAGGTTAVAPTDFSPPAVAPPARTGTSSPIFQPTFGRALTPQMFSPGTGTAGAAPSGMIGPDGAPMAAPTETTGVTGFMPVTQPLSLVPVVAPKQVVAPPAPTAPRRSIMPSYPEAPADPVLREVGRIYQTPQGPARWTRDIFGKVGWKRLMPTQVAAAAVPRIEKSIYDFLSMGNNPEAQRFDLIRQGQADERARLASPWTD